MKNFIFITSIFIAHFAFAQSKNGIIEELKKYKSGDGLKLSEDYVSTFPTTINNLIAENENTFLKNSQNNCVNHVKINILNQITQSSDPVIKDFESSFILIDVANCFENKIADKLISKIMTIDFKKKAYTNIKSIEQQTDGKTYCEVNTIAFAGSSNSCYVVEKDLTDLSYVKLMSYNTYNDPDLKKFEIPTYFRQSLATARQIGPNVQFHTITYVRSGKLSGLTKVIVKNSIENAQEHIIKLMKLGE